MESTTFIGGDVSKDTISFAIYGDTQPVQVVPNQKQALIAYLKNYPLKPCLQWKPPIPIIAYWWSWPTKQSDLLIQQV